MAEPQSATMVLQFNLADYAALSIVGISMIISIFRGLVKEAISLVTWIASFWLALHFCEQVAPMFSGMIATESLRLLLSFVAIFIAVMILGAVLGFSISKVVQGVGLSGTDRMLGMLFGIARGVLVVALLVVMASFTDIPKSDWWKQSVLLPHIAPVAKIIQAVLATQLNTATV